MVGKDSLIISDLTDMAKYYARSLECLGRVRHAIDPDLRTATRYMLFAAHVRSFPMALEPLKTDTRRAEQRKRRAFSAFPADSQRPRKTRNVGAGLGDRPA